MIFALDDVSIVYRTADEEIRAVSNVSIALAPGGSLGLVGESGCGKSTLALAALGLLPPEARLTSGAVRFEGRNLASLPEKSLRALRWRRMAYVPQSAQNALVPVHSLRRQFRDTAAAHGLGALEADRRAEALLRQVELQASVLDRFPHELSGGMRQRAIMALALLFGPALLVADEPTTGLDVIVQRQLVALLRELRAERNLALLFISHDIGIVAELCAEIAVLYAGRVMESGRTEDVIARPAHPYTMGLRRSFPDIRFPERALISIGGHPPRLSSAIPGCPFAPRCPFEQPICRTVAPRLEEVEPDRAVACHFADRAPELLARSHEPGVWERAA